MAGLSPTMSGSGASYGSRGGGMKPRTGERQPVSKNSEYRIAAIRGRTARQHGLRQSRSTLETQITQILAEFDLICDNPRNLRLWMPVSPLTLSQDYFTAVGSFLPRFASSAAK